MYRLEDNIDSQTDKRVVKFQCDDLKTTDLEVLKYIKEEMDDEGPIASVKIIDRYFKVNHGSDELIIEVGIRYNYFYNEEYS